MSDLEKFSSGRTQLLCLALKKRLIFISTPPPPHTPRSFHFHHKTIALWKRPVPSSFTNKWMLIQHHNSQSISLWDCLVHQGKLELTFSPERACPILRQSQLYNMSPDFLFKVFKACFKNKIWNLSGLRLQYILKAEVEWIKTFQCQTHLHLVTGLQTRHTKRLKERKFAEEVARRIMLWF